MNEDNPRHFFLSLVIVGGTILFMSMLKNVFGIDSYDDNYTPPNEAYVEHGGDTHGESSNSNENEINLHEAQPDSDQHSESLPMDNSDSLEKTSEEVPESNNLQKEDEETLPDESVASYFNTLRSDYLKEFESLPSGNSRTDIVVRYYHHTPDNDNINALKNLRLYIHERTPDDSLEGYQSNSIYYGDSVRTEDIQLITYTLLQNGFEVKQIIPSKFHDSWKARSVEIGTDVEVQDKPTLSAKDIMEFRNTFLE